MSDFSDFSSGLFISVNISSVVIVCVISGVAVRTWGHPIITYAKFSQKLKFLTPWYAHVRVRVSGLEMLGVFWKILRMYVMNDPLLKHEINNVGAISTSLHKLFYYSWNSSVCAYFYQSLVSFWCFIVNFEHISHLVLVFLLVTLSR